MQLKVFVWSIFALNTALSLPLHKSISTNNHSLAQTTEDPIQKYQTLGKEIIASVQLAQVSEEDKSLSAQLFKYWNIALDSVYGLGCKFTNCLEPTPM